MSDLGTWICEEAASADDFISEDSKLEDDRAALVASEVAAAVRDSWKQNILVSTIFFKSLTKTNFSSYRLFSNSLEIWLIKKNLILP
jgi:hypothetical protein